MEGEIFAGLQNSREQTGHENFAVVIRTPDTLVILVFAIAHPLEQEVAVVAVIGTACHFGREALEGRVI